MSYFIFHFISYYLLKKYKHTWHSWLQVNLTKNLTQKFYKNIMLKVSMLFDLKLSRLLQLSRVLNMQCNLEQEWTKTEFLTANKSWKESS
jgi:hypothetical protein